MNYKNKLLTTFSLLLIVFTGSLTISAADPAATATPAQTKRDAGLAASARRRVARLCRKICSLASSANVNATTESETPAVETKIQNLRLLAIGDEYLKNFNPLDPKDAKDRACFQELFKMLASVPCQAGTQETPKHLRDLYRDLSIFFDRTHPRSSLLDCVSRCHTRSGIVNLAERLACPSSNISMLMKSQDTILTIGSNEPLQTNLETHLAQLAECEATWLEHDNVLTYNWINKLIFIPFLLKSPLASDAWFLYAQTMDWKILLKNAISYWNMFMRGNLLSQDSIAKLIDLPQVAIIETASITQNKRGIELLMEIQKQLIHVAQYLRSAKYLHAIVREDEVLGSLLATPHLDMFFDKSKPLPPDVQQFFSQIKSRTFKGQPSYLSRFGSVLSTAHYFLKTKEYFSGMIKEIGLIDSYLSCAKLMQEQPGRWCFPTYIEADSPQINCKNIWHPKLSLDKAVPSSIALGGEVNAKNALVMGPNGGGKSTTTQATFLGLFIGETLGITPAEAASFTPFATLATFAAVPDDVISGQSKFNAEAAKTQQICQLAKNAATRGFAFFFLDEIITGTDPEHSEAIVYAITKRLGLSKNVMFTLCTHHHGLYELGAEDPNRFGLFTVPSTVGADGSINHSYTLTPGPYDEQGTQFATLVAQDVPQSLIKIAQQRHINMRSRL